MAQRTYELIERQTLASSASSVTFSGLSGYRDYVLAFDNVQFDSSDKLAVTFNGDSTLTNYNVVRMYGDGSSAVSNSGNTPEISGDRAKTRFDGIFQVMDASATDKDKTFLVRFRQNDSGTVSTFATAGRWDDTSAITSMTILGAADGDNLIAGSTFAIYGIVA